jgi:hypothetical protein
MNPSRVGAELSTTPRKRGHPHESAVISCAHSFVRYALPMKRLSPITTRAAFALLAIPLLMGAEAYRWVDKDGVHYTQQAPPEGIKAEKIRFREGGMAVTVDETPSPTPPASGTAGAGAPTGGDQNLTPDQQTMLENLRKAEAARQAEVVKIREANCTKAREVLERLSVTGRIRVRDESGQERAMSEDERKSRIDEAQRAIVQNCTTNAG